VGADSRAGVGKPEAVLARAYGTKSGKVVHLRRDKAAKRKKARFQNHLGKGHIVVYAFHGGFFDIKDGQSFDKIDVRPRVAVKQKSGQIYRMEQARSHNVAGNPGQSRNFLRLRDLNFFRNLNDVRTCGKCPNGNLRRRRSFLGSFPYRKEGAGKEKRRQAEREAKFQVLHRYEVYRYMDGFSKQFSCPCRMDCMEYSCEAAPAIRTTKQKPYPGPLSLPKEDRPRERLIRCGPESLSDEALLSIILVSGVRGKNVTLLARELLEKLDKEREAPSVMALCALTGLGISKACTVAAMLEFGRRKWAGGQRIRHPTDIFNLIRHHADRRQERFLCLSLNGAHEVLAKRIVTIGLVNRTIIHPREVFADPILDRASAVVVAHNHPSGNLKPSEEDNEITRRLKSAAEILGINFLDHLIFSEAFYFSYRQEGLMGKETTF